MTTEPTHPEEIDRDDPITFSNGDRNRYYRAPPSQIFSAYAINDLVRIHDLRESNRRVDITPQRVLDPETQQAVNVRPLPDGRDIFGVFEKTGFVVFKGQDLREGGEEPVALNPEFVKGTAMDKIKEGEVGYGTGKVIGRFFVGNPNVDGLLSISVIMELKAFEEIQARIEAIQKAARKQQRQLTQQQQGHAGGGGQWAGGGGGASHKSRVSKSRAGRMPSAEGFTPDLGASEEARWTEHDNVTGPRGGNNPHFRK